MSVAHWIGLKTGPKTEAAILSIIPEGPYIIAPQHASAEYGGIPWGLALDRAERLADKVIPNLEIMWGTVVFANEDGRAVKVAYYYDTSD